MSSWNLYYITGTVGFAYIKKVKILWIYNILNNLLRKIFFAVSIPLFAQVVSLPFLSNFFTPTKSIPFSPPHLLQPASWKESISNFEGALLVHDFTSWLTGELTRDYPSTVAELLDELIFTLLPREITVQPASWCSFIKPCQSPEIVCWPQSDNSNTLVTLTRVSVAVLRFRAPTWIGLSVDGQKRRSSTVAKGRASYIPVIWRNAQNSAIAFLQLLNLKIGTQISSKKPLKSQLASYLFTQVFFLN